MQRVEGWRSIGKGHKAGMIEGAYFVGESFNLGRRQLVLFTQGQPETPPEERLVGGVLGPRSGIAGPRPQRRPCGQRRSDSGDLPFKATDLRLIKSHQGVVAIKDDGLDLHELNHKPLQSLMQWAKSTARRLMGAISIVSDATPAGTLLLDGLLDPVYLAAQWARPRYQPGYTLAALVDERLLGAAYLSHERRRIGSAVLDVAGVTFHADAAARLALLEPIVVAAATVGLPWLQLDIPLEAEVGAGLAICALQFQLQLPPFPASAPTLRSATLDDWADLTALDAVQATAIPLSRERTAADWRWLITTAGTALQVLEDERGRLVGYALRSAEGDLSEAYAADAGVGRELLAALVAQGIEVGRFGFGHPLAHTALVHGGHLHGQAPALGSVVPHWGVIDLAGALHDLAPELGSRLRNSRYGGWQGRVDLEVAGRNVALVFTGDAVHIEAQPKEVPDVAVKRITLEALPQLLLGYRAVADLRASGKLTCAESDFGLLDILLPTLASA